MAASGSRLAEAARVFGAGPWRAFFRVTLPLSLPAIGASVLLAFTLAIEEYGVPAALGAQSGVSVLTTAIERRLADWPIDLPGAALLSLVLVALALTAFAVQRALLPGAVSRPPASRRRWRRPSWAPGAALLLFALVALAAVAAPLASMLAAALTRNLSGGLSLANLTLANFARCSRRAARPGTRCPPACRWRPAPRCWPARSACWRPGAWPAATCPAPRH